MHLRRPSLWVFCLVTTLVFVVFVIWVLLNPAVTPITKKKGGNEHGRFVRVVQEPPLVARNTG